MMITLLYVHYEIHDEVRKNGKVHNSFIKNITKRIFLQGTVNIFFQANFFTKCQSFPFKINIFSESEFNEFESRLKSAKNRFQLSAGLNLETLNTILNGINYVLKFKPRLIH